MQTTYTSFESPFFKESNEVVLLLLNKACKSYGALFRRQCNIYTEIINAESRKFDKRFDMKQAGSLVFILHENTIKQLEHKTVYKDVSMKCMEISIIIETL